MTKARMQAAALGGSADDIEAAFYDAMQSADIGRMMACWADEDDIVCIHPGGGRLLGAGTIRAAFEAMFSQGVVRVRPVQVRKIEALTSAVHHVVERVEVMTETGWRTVYVAATNVYHKTAQGWRLVVHHASPDAGDGALQAQADGPQTLH